MRLAKKAAFLGAVAGAGLVPAVASAHLVSVSDPRGDAKGPFDLKSTSIVEDRGLRVTVSQYGTVPRRPPGMPCVAFDYRSAKGVERFACPAMSGAHYELRNVSTGKLVARVKYTRPDAKSVRLVVSGRLLDGDRGIRWQAYLEGGHESTADETRWALHDFAD